jgi:hypothetical protein
MYGIRKHRTGNKVLSTVTTLILLLSLLTVFPISLPTNLDKKAYPYRDIIHRDIPKKPPAFYSSENNHNCKTRGPAPELLITKLNAPGSVNPTSNVTIFISIRANFSTPTDIFGGIWDDDLGNGWVTTFEDNITGEINKTYSLIFKAPSEPDIYAYVAHIGYYDSVGDFHWTDNEGFAIYVYEQLEYHRIVALIVDEVIYSNIKTRLDQYKSDVKAIYNVTFLEYNGTWDDASQLRSYIKELYQNENISGVIFIGLLPYAMWKFPWNETCPIPFYYEDLDGWFNDTDGDGYLDNHTWGVNDGPEIWTALMRPQKKVYEEYVQDMKDYLDKCHAFYSGNLEVQNKAFVCINHDWGGATQAMVDSLSNIYVETDSIGGDNTYVAGQQFLDNLTNGYELTDIWSHSSSTFHQFDRDPHQYVTTLDIQDLIPGSRFTIIWGCHAADFDESPSYNLAIGYVFGDSHGIASLGATRSIGTGKHEAFYSALTSGMDLGQTFFTWLDYEYNVQRIQNWFPDDDINKFLWDFAFIGNPFITIANHDLTPLDISVMDNDANGKDNVTISTTIKNIGDAGVFNPTITFYVDDVRIGDDIIDFIGANKTKTSQMNWTVSPGHHVVEVIADYGNVIVESNESNNMKTIDTYAISLEPGMRLISLPLIQSDKNITTVLQTIEGNYDNVQWYDPLDMVDNWLSYTPNKPSGFNDLLNVDHKIALWINMISGDTLTITGKVPSSTSIQLYEGWNFVGYPSLTNRTVGDALSSIWENVTQVEGFDETSSPYYLKLLTDGDMMKTGEGYWIKVTNDCEWIVND